MTFDDLVNLNFFDFRGWSQCTLGRLGMGMGMV